MQLTSHRYVPLTFSLLTLLASLVHAQQTVLYPPQDQTYNNIDAVNVVYETTYSAVNITLFCRENAKGDYAFHAYDGNPLPASGTAYFAPIQEEVSLNFATSTGFQCHMAFVDPATATDYFNSVNFLMVSTAGVASTWSATSTSSTSSSTAASTSTSTSSSSTSSSSTTGAAATTTPTSTRASQTSSASSSSTAVPASSSSSSSLSTGAAAGIGVGVALGVIALAALLFFLLLRRRRSSSAKVASTEMSNTAPGQKYDYHPVHGQGVDQYPRSPPTDAYHGTAGHPGYGQQPPTQQQGYNQGYGSQQPVYESGGRPVASELPGHEGRYELS